MTLSPKQEMIKCFFDQFEKKINRLAEFRKQGFEDEAFTLCLVYIDRLASGHFGGKEGQNRKNFWRALSELSGNPLFGMIHPRHLQRLTQKFCPAASALINEIVNRQPDALLEEGKVAEETRNSSLLEEEKLRLIRNLWRASMANIAYDYIRAAEVHGPGSGGLSFDKTIYSGQTGLTLEFEKFYEALKHLFKHVMDFSISSSHWFGNPDYMKERE